MSEATAAGPAGPRLAPLTARSVLLSVLLGSHPPELPVRALVRAAELFGISDGSARVALSRLNSDGDVTSCDGVYRLSPRLADRQADQDRAVRPATRSWRGGWELVVADPATTTADRAALGAAMVRLRLAELRPGVWGRPDNLLRPWPPLPGPAWRFTGRPEPRDTASAPSLLAARLWPLSAWAEGADELIRAMRTGRDPADRFMVAAAMVRHLRADPVLPPALLPPRWPGARLRGAYDGYRRELGDMLRRSVRSAG